MTSPPPRRLAALAAFLLAAACSSNGPEVDPERELDLYMTTATYLYQSGDLVRAQDQAVKALRIDPENRAMRQMIGWIRIQMGRTEDLIVAEQMLAKLVEEEELVPSVLGLATARERLGVGYDAAAREAEDERAATRLREKARGYWRSAAEHYEKVLTAPTAGVKAMNGLARTTGYLGDYEKSLAWNQRLLESLRAELEGLDRLLEARELTETEESVARESRTGNVDLQIDAHAYAAELLLQLGRADEVIAHCDAAIALDPSLPDFYGFRARARAEGGDWAGAIEDVDQFLRTSTAPFEDPDVRAAYDLRTRCERELRDAADETAAVAR